MSDKMGLSAAGRALLWRLRVPQAPEDLSQSGLPSKLLSDMLEAGLLEPQSDTVAPTDYQDSYVNWPSQRGMMLDHTRTLAFQKAIETMVDKGDRVIDVGAGSGILTMMAARAGASDAIGLELTDMADWATLLADENGLDAVRIVRGDAGEFTPEGPADLIMGEFAGMYLIDEWRHYAAFAKVRDRTLRKGGKVLPQAGRLYLSAIDSRKMYLVRGYGFWEEPVYGFDFTSVRNSEITWPRRYIVTADPNNVVDTKKIADFDFLTGNERDFFFEAEAVFTYPAGGSFHGVAGHFEMDMAPGQVLSTSPFAPDTHWHQSYFPVPALGVPAGGEVRVAVRTDVDPESGILHLGLKVAGPGEKIGPDTPEHVYAVE